MELCVDQVESPIGAITLMVAGGALCAVEFEASLASMRALAEARYGAVTLRTATDPHGFSSCVRAYLNGELDALAAIPVKVSGTAFQREVWAAVRAIPPGATRAYGEIA